MDLSKTGKLISFLRKEKGFTQKELAEKIGICSKTVSKWETGNGFPDISLLCKLAEIFTVDIGKLIEGEIPETKIKSENVARTKFYVCQTCGNVITSMGSSEIVCCGRKLSALKPVEPDEKHKLNVEKAENDFYITFSHPMEKEHYISFVAYVRFDRILVIKLYPEQGGEVRFPQMYGGRLYYYCNNHGLFYCKI